MIPTPTPTTPDQSTLLFYVLLALIVVTAALSGYALYRTTQKTKSDALSSLTDALAKSGGTIEDLLALVGKRMEIENVAIELRAQVAKSVSEREASDRTVTDLRGRVAMLEETQRELQRQLVIKDGKLEERGQEIAVLSSKLDAAQKQITAQETEIKDLRQQLDAVKLQQAANGAA